MFFLGNSNKNVHCSTTNKHNDNNDGSNKPERDSSTTMSDANDNSTSISAPMSAMTTASN